MENLNFDNKINNQKNLWNEQHSSREREHLSMEYIPNISAVNIVGYIPENGTVLEIGAGNGRDARFFIREKNCAVIAVDFSENAIDQMIQCAKNDNTSDKLNPVLVDTRSLETPPIDSLDLFYARSSLHLSDEDLYTLFDKIVPALKKDAHVFIEGKTANDLKISRSSELGSNLVEDIDGHIRRSWDAEFIRNICTRFDLELVQISDTLEFWDSKETHFINFLAKKR